MNNQFKIERKGGLLALTLTNPNGNRIGFGVLEGLRAAVNEVKSGGVRAVYIRGQGEVFSYGADVTEFTTRPPAELFPLLTEYVSLLGELEASVVPTFAAVHGVCLSGGLELALAFDQIWAAKGTKLGFLEANIATPPLSGGVQRVAARAGSSRAFQIGSAGHFYDADDFDRWNIVNRVLAADTFFAEADAYAAKLAVGPTLAYAGTKKLLREWDRNGVSGADRMTIPTVAPIMGSNDSRSAMATILRDGPTHPQTTFSGN